MKIASLAERKYRDREGLFRFDGIKLFREAAACGIAVRYVVLREDVESEYLPEVLRAAPQAEILVVAESAFSKICFEKAPEGIITVAKYIDKIRKTAKINDITVLGYSEKRIFALESVRDPGNLGTVVRTAAALGIDCLLISSDCADIYNPKTLRAAMGAAFVTEIVQTGDLAAALVELAACGRRTYAATLSKDARTIDKTDFSGRDCIVVGNEGHGLSSGVAAACGACVILPMRFAPGVESLNAAVAASIFMWETSKRPF